MGSPAMFVQLSVLLLSCFTVFSNVITILPDIPPHHNVHYSHTTTFTTIPRQQVAEVTSASASSRSRKTLLSSFVINNDKFSLDIVEDDDAADQKQQMGNANANETLLYSFSLLPLLLLAALPGAATAILLAGLPGAKSEYIAYNTTARIVPRRINVHLVPHFHNDVEWLKTVDQCFVGANNLIRGACVQNVLNAIISALLKEKNQKFIYVEIAFFQRWWRQQSLALKAKVKELVSSSS